MPITPCPFCGGEHNSICPGNQTMFVRAVIVTDEETKRENEDLKQQIRNLRSEIFQLRNQHYRHALRK